MTAPRKRSLYHYSYKAQGVVLSGKVLAHNFIAARAYAGNIIRHNNPGHEVDGGKISITWYAEVWEVGG